MKSRIPLIISEEHHEAFYIWHYAVEKGWMNPSGNRLLHIDEHDDFSIPRLSVPLADLDHDFETIKNFAFNDLNIGNFIWPSVYQGWFSHLYWMRASMRKDYPLRELFICTVGDARTEFLTGMGGRKRLDIGNDDRKYLQYHSINLEHTFETTDDIVFGFCLDYFSCNVHPTVTGNEVEVTEETYNAYQDNPYHYLKLTPGAAIKSEVRDGRYYLSFNKFDNVSLSRLREDKPEIQQRIDNLINFFRSRKITPKMIHISRSAISGYTPSDQVDFIQERLVKGLEELYQLEIIEAESLSI